MLANQPITHDKACLNIVDHNTAGLAEQARQCRARLLHVEDGFVRSVGLGSDLEAVHHPLQLACLV